MPSSKLNWKQKCLESATNFEIKGSTEKVKDAAKCDSTSSIHAMWDSSDKITYKL